MKRRKFGWPLMLIALGAIFLLRNLGIISFEFYEILFSWPMILVAIGVVQLIDRYYVSGFILLFLGGLFMLPRLDIIIEYDVMRIFWPIALIVIGAILLFRRRGTSYDQPNHMTESGAPTDPDGFVRIDVSFSSTKTVLTDPVFRGAILRSTFGGIDLDLRNARLESPEVYVDIDCNFGGITLRVPPTWRIDSRINSTFGGFDDKRPRLSTDALDTTHTVILRGTATFGGVDLK